MLTIISMQYPDFIIYAKTYILYSMERVNLITQYRIIQNWKEIDEQMSGAD